MDDRPLDESREPLWDFGGGWEVWGPILFYMALLAGLTWLIN